MLRMDAADLVARLNAYESGEKGAPRQRGPGRDVWRDVITPSNVYDPAATGYIDQGHGDRLATTGGMVIRYDSWRTGQWQLETDSVDARVARLAATAGRIRQLNAQQDAARHERDELVRQLWNSGIERKQLSKIAGINRANTYRVAEGASASRPRLAAS